MSQFNPEFDSFVLSPKDVYRGSIPSPKAWRTTYEKITPKLNVIGEDHVIKFSKSLGGVTPSRPTYDTVVTKSENIPFQIPETILREYLSTVNGGVFQSIVFRVAGHLWSAEIAASVLKSALSSGLYSNYLAVSATDKNNLKTGPVQKLKKQLSLTIAAQLPEARDFENVRDKISLRLLEHVLCELRSNPGAMFSVGIGGISMRLESGAASENLSGEVIAFKQINHRPVSALSDQAKRSAQA